MLGNFQCWAGLLVWKIVGQGPTVLAVGSGGILTLAYILVSLFFLLQGLVGWLVVLGLTAL